MSGISEIKPVTSEITGPGGNSQAKIPETRGEQTGCDSTRTTREKIKNHKLSEICIYLRYTR